MNIREYQVQAQETDQRPEHGNESLMVPLLGLAGETGSLLTEYKKLLRDGNAYRIFDDRIAEELGDILWYVANIATKAGLDLADIARKNLAKVRNRWLSKESDVQTKPFDEDFPEKERIPRQFRIIFSQSRDSPMQVIITINGQRCGDPLTDNAYDADGYRFHDVFHLAYAAVLGWSPVTRKLLDCKRKSRREIDEIEDGGRAKAIEEGIAALVFDYAKRRSFLKDVVTIDYELLRTIKDLTSHLEVQRRSLKQWESAILTGFHVWRYIQENSGGVVLGDLRDHTLIYESSPKNPQREEGSMRANRKATEQLHTVNNGDLMSMHLFANVATATDGSDDISNSLTTMDIDLTSTKTKLTHPDFSISPPNPPWHDLHSPTEAGGYLSIYYNDDLSRLPVRWVTKPGDNKSDPNLETLTYGLFSTCAPRMRSGIVTRRCAYLFFATSRYGTRVLTGYYRLRWYAAGVFANMRDFCLAAERAHFVEEPIPLVEVDRLCQTDLARRFRGMRLLSSAECRKLAALMNARSDATTSYLEEIDRLERFNLKHGRYRYVTRKQTEKFSWNVAREFLATPKASVSTVPLRNSSPSGLWTCSNCSEIASSKALLKQCPNCKSLGMLVPI